MSFFKDRKDKGKEPAGEQRFMADLSALEGNGFLKGKLLVAMPSLQDSYFSKSVVLICDHSKTGGMGLIINKHLHNVDQADLYQKLGLEKPEDGRSHIDVYFGGPVESSRGFVVHSDDYRAKNTIEVSPGVMVTSEHQILKDYLENKGPKNLSLVMGYAGWTSGQMEKEIEENSWLAFPADSELVFDTHNDSKWQKAAANYGIDLNNIGITVGNA